MATTQYEGLFELFGIEEVTEKLDECEHATSFLQVSNEIINDKLKEMLPSVFVQNKLVMEYAVEPLLKENGPLVSTDVISKLMFAMGKISVQTYSDIGLYGQLLDYTLSQSTRLLFSDDVVYDFIENQAILKSPQNNIYLDSIKQLKFSSFDAFSQQRYESLVKTVLKLSCETLLNKIEEEIHQ